MRNATALFALLMLFACSSGKNLSNGAIHGVVTDEWGAVLPGVTVKMGQNVTITDATGHYTFSNVPSGRYDLEVELDKLRAEDRVAIVVYAGAAGLALPSTSDADKQTIIAALDRLQAGGSTAGAQGIQLAYDVAKQNFIASGNNRVILATDGDFNVGITSHDDLLKLIEERRDDGVYLTTSASAMTTTATPTARGRVASLRLRYKQPAGTTSELITAEAVDDGRNIHEASPDLQFA